MCRGITCIVLTVINAVFLISGLALLALGALLRWNQDVIKKLMNVASEQVKGDSNGVGQNEVSQALKYIQDMMAPIGYVLFFAGITICCIALLAFIGLCCHIRVAMIVYAALVGAVIVVHVLLLIIYFSNKNTFIDPLHKKLENLVTQYKSVDSGEPISIALAIIMPQFKCCGYQNGNDFSKPGSLFTRRDNVKGQDVSNLKYPLPCCVPDRTGTSPQQCPQTFNASTSFIEVGCQTRVDNAIIPFIDYILTMTLIVLAFEAIVFSLAMVNLFCV